MDFVVLTPHPFLDPPSTAQNTTKNTQILHKFLWVLGQSSYMNILILAACLGCELGPRF